MYKLVNFFFYRLYIKGLSYIIIRPAGMRNVFNIIIGRNHNNWDSGRFIRCFQFFTDIST